MNEYIRNGRKSKLIIKGTKMNGEIDIDASDIKRLEQKQWYVQQKGNNTYIISNDSVMLSRYILGITEDVWVGYIDGNPFNNKKANLKPMTRQEVKAKTQVTPINNKSGHPGVIWHRNSWRAYFNLDGKRYSKDFSPKRNGGSENAYKLACEYVQGKYEVFKKVNNF